MDFFERNIRRETCTAMAWEAHLAIGLQSERLRGSDSFFQGRSKCSVDATALIIALWRLRLAATMCAAITGETTSITSAIARFDDALPGLKRLRDVAMHFDNYALENEKRRNKIGDPPRFVGPSDLWDFKPTASGFTWLEVTITYDDAETSGRALYDAIQESNNSQLVYDE